MPGAYTAPILEIVINALGNMLCIWVLGPLQGYGANSSFCIRNRRNYGFRKIPYVGAVQKLGAPLSESHNVDYSVGWALHCGPLFMEIILSGYLGVQDSFRRS